MVINSQKPQQQNWIKYDFYIKASEVRVIAEDGSNLGIHKLADAIKMAKDIGVNLVEINPKENICKLVELGKYKYEQKKKENEIRKKTAVSEEKQIQLHYTTAKHDLDRLILQAQKFMQDGHRVQFLLRLRGRENSHPDVALETLKSVLLTLGDINILVGPKLEAKSATMTVASKK